MSLQRFLTFLIVFSGTLLSFVFVSGPAFPAQGQGNRPPVFSEVPLPKSLSLCGESMPLEDSAVWEMLDRELTISVWDRAQVFMWLKRAGRYFPYIEMKLKQAGMPSDLKYLAVAESSLLTHIRSGKGALGTWQFMAQTARNHGLRKDRVMDERRDFETATGAAIRYLTRLHDEFGSWALSLAAYNCGEACVRRAIKEQKEKDYYRLNLPMETERFVFRIAAIKLIMEDPERYGYRIHPERIYRPVPCDRVKVRIRRTLHLTDVAQAIGTRYKTLKELNPQIRGSYLPRGRYILKVPKGMGERLEIAIAKIAPRASSGGRARSGSTYTVEPGDTLSRISARTGVPMSTLRHLNNIQGSKILVGQKLRLGP